MSKEVMDAFNKGEAIETTEGGGSSEIVDMTLKIKTVFIEEYTAKSGDTYERFAIELVNPNKEVFKVFQNIFYTKEGVLQNPANPGYTKKDGTRAFPTTIYEIMEASKKFNEKTYEEKKASTLDENGKRKWKEFLEDLKFNFKVKVTESESSPTGAIYFLMTEYQIDKDEQYKKSKADNTQLVETVLGGKKKEDQHGNKIGKDDLPF